MKRKVLFTLMLAIVSSVWMMSEATCLTQAPNELYWSYITVSGTIQWLDSPCEEGEECPPCVTPAIVTSDKTYYLSSSNQEVRDFLDRIELAPIPAIYLLPLQARASGTPYTQGSFDFLVVSNIDDLYVQYFSDQLTRLPSLCDEWNVVHISNYGDAFTVTQKLTTDTIINEHVYVKSDYAHKYRGAFREGENRDIYCVPATSNEEYLVYAWNAQVGDTLYNLLVGGGIMYAYQFSERAVVREIKETVPRTFVVDYEYIYNRRIDSADTTWWEYQWIEGVGMTCGPSGDLCPFDICRGVIKSEILCAYKNGAHIFTSDLGEQYGCVYNYDPYSTPVDTIPLYAGDDPGSSTVDPVDPNQVVVTLKGDELSIHENMGVDITYTLQHNSPAQAPSQRRAPQSDTFRDEVTIQITASGEYLLQLTNPSWDYTIFGRFYYSPQGIWNVVLTEQAQKVVVDGVIYIVRDCKMFNVQGAQVR